MDTRQIKNISFYSSGCDFLAINSNRYLFSWLHSNIYSNAHYNVKELLASPELIEKIRESEFNLVENRNYNKDTGKTIVNIEVISEAFVRSEDRKERKTISCFRYVKSSEIDSFYQFKVDIVVKGVRIPDCHIYNDGKYPDAVCVCRSPEYKHLAAGEIWGWDYSLKDYLILKKDIDQVIGVKRYRDPNFIDRYDNNKFTGEKEEVVLDLNNFDMDTYQFFKDHHALEIEFVDE